MMKTLRTDQWQAIEKLRASIAAGHKRVIIQAPTGAGKTIIATGIIEAARAKGKKVVLTVPQIALIDQTVRALYEQGIRDVGVIQASHRQTDWSRPVQVCSVATLEKKDTLPEADLVIIDEVHKWFKFFEKWICDAAWQKVPFIGLSATPWTRGLGAYFSERVIANTFDGLISMGVLVPVRTFAAAHPDMSKVRTVAGEWHEGDLHETMSNARLVADIVTSWKELGEGRPTVCFAVNRAHAEQLAGEFRAAGIGADKMDCETPQGERDEIRKRFLAGELKVVCNVDVIGLGVDWPEVGCIIYARPTKSEMRFVQNIGRGLRAHESKLDCIVLDHSDTTLRLGFVTGIQRDRLCDGKTAERAKEIITLPRECPKCHYLKAPRVVVCPNCGFKVEAHKEEIRAEKGTLKEVRPDDVDPRASPAAKNFSDKRKTYAMMLGYALQKGIKPGMAYHKFKKLFGHEPNFRGVDPVMPNPTLVSWLTAENIRYRAGMEKAAGGVNAPEQLSARQQEIIDQVRTKFVPGTLCTEADLGDFY